MKLATWNVNSVRQRERHVTAFLDRVKPDLLLLQELKCEEGNFPGLAFSANGYRAEVVGQKSYNGVAILSRAPVRVVNRSLPGLPEGDAQARFIEIEVGGIHVINGYMPNGNSGGADGFAYKIAWLNLLADHAERLLATDTPLIIAGDYNVCPTDEDYASGALNKNDALLRPESRAAYRRLIWLGLLDSVRALQPTGTAYTFWDYQAGAWPRDLGLRIDHVLLSPTLGERLASVSIERRERGEDQPSDHVPVVVELTD